MRAVTSHHPLGPLVAAAAGLLAVAGGFLILSFYSVVAGIVIAAGAMILEIWDILNDELRNRILLTLAVAVVAILAVSITNLLFSVAEEQSDDELPERDSGRDIGDSLRRAKAKSE